MGTLYVVATPIGNLEDVSARALRILGEVGLVAAEDTRTAGVLLRRYEIRSPELVSYTEHNRGRRIPYIVERLATTDVALVSDAGTPAVSDPGIELVAAARDAGYDVIAVAGPSAVAAAVSVSGLRVATFRFAGFLPRGKSDLRAVLAEQTTRPEALVAFESPNRLRDTLAFIDETLPDTRIAVCRELTKLHEETFAGTASEALAHFTEPRGEIVLVIEGANPNAQPAPDGDETLRAEIATMRRLGLTRTQATTLLGERYGLPRRRLYELWLQSEM